MKKVVWADRYWETLKVDLGSKEALAEQPHIFHFLHLIMQKVGGETLQHYYQELHEVIKTHAGVIGTRCLIQTGQQREKCQSRENSWEGLYLNGFQMS